MMSDACSMYEYGLTNAVKNARYLKSKGFDWSSINLYDFHIIQKEVRFITPTCSHPLFNLAHFNEYMKVTRHVYEKWKYSNMWEIVLYNLLMEYVLANNPSVSILDVGSGTSEQFRIMCTGLDTSRIATYTTIDKKPSSEIHNILYKEYPEIQSRHKHIEVDVFNSKDELRDCQNQFDILIMDVEPHGKEIDVYNIVYPYMRNEHIVICKCIGFIDLFGSAMANRLLLHMQAMSILHSSFGCCDINYLTRDIIAIVNKNKTEYRGMVFDCDNEKYSRYKSTKEDIISTMMDVDAFYEHLLQR